ncbi:HlyD family efflux transporter periplasmic adaptor subunit [Aquihabitans sp. McL0605]|uniref:HlyD family efflux transporter periplasmic adaptor subunit n=1 Tax=Aquihabitans sp. McL0605 TaxID=3415671 RepID=UPI003CEEF4ED
MRTVFTPKRLVAGGVAVVVLVGAVAAASARSDTSPSYRTATASTQPVDQVLHSVATVEPVSQASVAFPVAGTVDAVNVSVGEQVTVGSPLASLDVADLEVTVHEKQAALDQADLTLSLALSGEDVGSVSGGSPSSGGFGRLAASGSSAELKAAQQAVLDAQQAVDDAAAAAQLAFDDATAVCSSDAVAGAVDGGTTTTTAANGDDSAACLTALQAVLDAQAQVTAAQEQLTDAADALTTLLDQLATDAGTTTTTTPTQPTNPGGGSGGGSTSGGSGSGGFGSSGGSTPSGSGSGGSGGGSSTSSPSAEDLIAYQKHVDAAADELAVAQQAVDQAAIVSPIDGTVASVDLAVGDAVTAGSSTATIVVVGQGGYEVTTSISVKHLPDVKVGQAATVTPDGDEHAVDGKVVRIGVAPESSSSTSYLVTIALTGDTSAMGNGSTASVVIVTSAADRALAVPTSAVTVDGATSTVQELVDGKVKTTTVKTGAVGQTWTEITSGLTKGDVVVLADMDEALPGSATDGSSSTTGNRQLPGGGTFTFPGGGSGGPPSGLGGGTRPGG